MSKYEEADLILKLYELRREEKMRLARTWYAREFNPESLDEINQAMYGEHSGYFRMVLTYWDMAGALVKHGAISADFFNDSNGEQFLAFCKIEPMLEEIRAVYGPAFAANLEYLVDASPNGRKRSASTRESMRVLRARITTEK